MTDTAVIFSGAVRSAAPYVFWLALYGFIGWVYESILCSVKAKKWINRGFLHGPYCPIYGFGAVTVLLVLGRIGNPVMLFFLGALLTCTLEYLTSWVMEKLFHARWWDYHYMKFHINGRVCLAGAVIFGAMTVIVVKWVHPPVAALTARIPMPVLLGLDAVLIAGGAADTVTTVVRLKSFNRRLKEIDAKVREIVESGRAEFREKMRRNAEERQLRAERLRQAFEARRAEWEKALAFQRSLKTKFPSYRSVRWHEAFEELRRTVKKP